MTPASSLSTLGWIGLHKLTCIQQIPLKFRVDGVFVPMVMFLQLRACFHKKLVFIQEEASQNSQGAHSQLESLGDFQFHGSRLVQYKNPKIYILVMSGHQHQLLHPRIETAAVLLGGCSNHTATHTNWFLHTYTNLLNICATVTQRYTP